MNLSSAWLKEIHVWCCSWRVESNFHVLLRPYGGVLQGAVNPFSETHSILTTFLEKQQLAASENC